MSTTELGTDGTSGAAKRATVPFRFEVTLVAVTDVDRAKAFYERLGWRLDADFPLGDHDRIVQFTPPGSPASVQFGTGLTDMTPGSSEGLYLIVDDVEVARDELIANGADVSDIWHGRGLGHEGMQPGLDPGRGSYASFASFSDPDGNRWLLQEIGVRLPGRVGLGDSAALADLLKETATRHGSFEAVAPPHDWWDWYAAYMDARERGITPDESAEAANRYMAEVKHVVVPSST
jgi:catechol 2,3-dioxygenase-like lactoylglutathione lyase family enzyme